MAKTTYAYGTVQMAVKAEAGMGAIRKLATAGVIPSTPLNGRTPGVDQIVHLGWTEDMAAVVTAKVKELKTVHGKAWLQKALAAARAAAEASAHRAELAVERQAVLPGKLTELFARLDAIDTALARLCAASDEQARRLIVIHQDLVSLLDARTTP